MCIKADCPFLEFNLSQASDLSEITSLGDKFPNRKLRNSYTKDVAKVSYVKNELDNCWKLDFMFRPAHERYTREKFVFFSGLC